MSRIATFALVIATHAAALSQLTAQGQTVGPDKPLDVFSYLAGSCWTGTFPGSTVTDEHCFEWLHDGKFLRDVHTVRGAKGPYSGETTYAWDSKNKRIVYWYIGSNGAYSTGTAEARGDTIVFPETYVSNGEKVELLNTWARTGPDAYLNRVVERSKAGEKERRAMEMRRTR